MAALGIAFRKANEKLAALDPSMFAVPPNPRDSPGAGNGRRAPSLRARCQSPVQPVHTRSGQDHSLPQSKGPRIESVVPERHPILRAAANLRGRQQPPLRRRWARSRRSSRLPEQKSCDAKRFLSARSQHVSARTKIRIGGLGVGRLKELRQALERDQRYDPKRSDVPLSKMTQASAVLSQP